MGFCLFFIILTVTLGLFLGDKMDGNGRWKVIVPFMLTGFGVTLLSFGAPMSMIADATKVAADASKVVADTTKVATDTPITAFDAFHSGMDAVFFTGLGIGIIFLPY